MELVSEVRSFGGLQKVYEHHSEICDCAMRFGMFLPPVSESQPVPLLTWLSGLTCTEENFLTKAGAQRVASELGVALLIPDTSPRGEDIPDSDDYDFGQGAGFYVNATEDPWTKNYRMYDYVVHELQEILDGHPVDIDRQGIFGHSMGGHGALTLHLKNQHLYKTVSAFSPIVAPSQVPWGEKAFTGYLGEDRTFWQQYDACELVLREPSGATILIDQGSEDDFLANQLVPKKFEDACRQSGQSLNLRMQDGYDHSYYFIASFIEDHIRHHANLL